MSEPRRALEVLRATSRTFSILIEYLPHGLQEAVVAAYLCLRAINEIENHPKLDNRTKSALLEQISYELQAAGDGAVPVRFGRNLASVGVLPEVTVRLGEWVRLAPAMIAPRVWDATATMAERVRRWIDVGWAIQTESDLNAYTFGVGGTAGLLLSDLWAWHDGTQTDRALAIGYGRGLQVVNMLCNRSDDLARGVDFFPDGWTTVEAHDYARRNLVLADAYLRALPAGPIQRACMAPFNLALATLGALTRGENRLNWTEVLILTERKTPLPLEVVDG